MISKKKIVAIVLFLLFGLSIFTFANPSTELEKAETGNRNNKTTTTTTTKPAVVEDNRVIATNTDNRNNTNTNNGVDNTSANTNTSVITNTQTTNNGDNTEEVNNAPVITLNGTDVIIRKNDTYKDMGAKASDVEDGDITSKIVVTSNVDTKVKGTYTVKYDVVDSKGVQAKTVTRNVVVVDVDGLNESIKEASELIEDLKNTTNKELKESLNNLEDEIKKGNKIVDDKKSTQEEVDFEKSIIDILIDTIKSTRFTVVFIDYDNSVVARASVKVGGKVDAPTVNERVGYNFVKWDKETDYVIDNMEVNAVYEYRNDTAYAINYYFEELNGNYKKDNRLSKKLTGTTNADIKVSPKEVTGFEVASKSVLEGTINADGTSELNVYYKRIVKNVTFTINNNEYKVVPYKYGEIIQAPSYNVPEGYNFSGWKNLGVMGVKDLTFNATEKIKTFTVTFYVDNRVYATQVVNYKNDVDLTKITNPRKNSSKPEQYTYSFNKWEGKLTSITSNENVVAKFDRIPTKYKVKYVMDDNTLIKEFDVNYGNNVPKLDKNPTKEGYVFVGFDNDAKKVTKDLVFKAIFAPSRDTKYYVSYYVEVENGYEFDKTVERKGTTNSNVNLENETKTGYVLNKTKSDIKGKISADGKAEFKLYFDISKNNKYTLVIKKEKLDGKYEVSSTPIKASTFENVTYDAKEIKGYVLDTEHSVLSTKVNVTGTSEIIAVYNLKESKVTFTINGKNYKTETYKYGQKIVAPAYKAEEGKDFSGWDVKDLVMGDKDITLNATLTNHEYTVTFMVDNSVYTTQKVEYDADVDLTKVANPTKDSTNTTVYTFDRWNGDLRKIHKDTTLVAHFNESERKYVVTFKNPDGSTIATDKVSYQHSAKAPKNPSYNNYKFVKWNRDYSSVTEDMIVTAVYQTGIKVEEEPNVQFEFKKKSTVDLSKLIKVYELFTDGSKNEISNYTTDLTTAHVVSNKTLTISSNGFNNTDIKYSVVDYDAFQSKFEVELRSESYSTRNGSVSMDNNFIKVTEHYSEIIGVDKVEVIYTNGSNIDLTMTDMVNYSSSYKKGSKTIYRDPVYIGTYEYEEEFTDSREVFGWIESDNVFGGYLGWKTEYFQNTRTVKTDVQTDGRDIKSVVIYYTRDGYGKFKVKFNKVGNIFKAVEEEKIA